MFCLPPADPSVKDGGEVFSGMCDNAQKKIELVGSAYEALKKKYAKLAARMEMGASANFESEDEEKKSSGDDEGEKMDAKQQEEMNKKRKTKTKAQIEKEAAEGDFYGLLGLEALKFEASEEQINKAYKKVALQNHPDKLGDKYDDKAKKLWLKIQEAYDTLSSSDKRRKYDSSLPFDEVIPGEDDFDEEDFYEVFGKCFTLNAQWSEKRPVPNIGDVDTPLAEVKKFYKFW